MFYNVEILLHYMPFVCGIAIFAVFLFCKLRSRHSVQTSTLAPLSPSFETKGYPYRPNAEITLILIKKGRYFRAYLSEGTPSVPMQLDRHGSYLDTHCSDAPSAELFLDRIFSSNHAYEEDQ